jgi:spore coat polysaccharide biosynthesis predicted glycosyltransferase SpsG
MSSKIIAILTDWGDSIGSGHVQRMTSLLWYLINRKNIEAYIVLDQLPPFFPEELRDYWKTEFNPKPEMIIRDMRDSTAGEMMALREISRVLTIDDNGEGRKIADHLIDMLPHTDNKNKIKKRAPDDLFIYGYGFMNSLYNLIGQSDSPNDITKQKSGKIIEKKIDSSIYPGFHSTEEYTEFLIDLLPADSRYAILRGEHSYLHIKGKRYRLGEESHAETLLSSKVLISHFGILLYEAYLSECRIVCINPSPYHSKLAERAKDHLGIDNLGEYAGLNRKRAKKIIRDSIREPVSNRISAQGVYQTVLESLERFCSYLMTVQ